MARPVRNTKASETKTVGQRRGRPPGSTTKAAPTKTRAPATVARKTVSAAPAVKVSKDDLRSQVEKLERTVTTLRTRNREAGRSAKEAAARIEELEAQVAKLEKQAAKSAGASPRRARAAAEPEPKRTVQRRRSSKERDPGDAVPPGVAVEDPEPMDEEATAAFENLEGHLRPDGE